MGFCWAALLTLLLSLPALADSLRLVTGDDYAPFTGLNLPGQGMLTQVVRAVLKRRGLDSSLDWQPWNRGYLETLRGDYDATFPHVPSPQREADFLFSDPLYIAQQHLYSHAERPIEVADLATLDDVRLCYPLGWQPPAAIQTLADQGRLQRHSPLGLTECAQLLQLQRDDLFVADRMLGDSALKASGAPATAFHRSTQILGRSTLHFIVPKSRPGAAELIAEFNQGLAELKASGEYQNLLQRYLEQSSGQ